MTAPASKENMEHIPKKYEKADLPKAACFESEDIGLQIDLIPSQSRRDPVTGVEEKIESPDFPLRLKLKGGKLQVTNTDVLKLVMDCPAYKSGQLRIDREDPTGFWRDTGMVEFETKPIFVATKTQVAKFSDLDLKKLQTAEKVAPLRV